ncbi:MAG: molybdopterin synthase sulfur carrier subunit [Betaproteobacteria bacterium HGW-Betaproteobacteria-18]|nr:MAG: molybdopterin synthase sulfur carrier subunit [Betaproteobacteria bacterium HGW-Betaproteobacteria-18]
MKITLKLFASLTDYLPVDAKYTNLVELDIAPETTIEQLVAQHRLPEKLVHLVLVNGHYIAPELRAMQTLKEGDVLAIWPPIAGG